ncbi:MAG: hypothetical protein ABFR47_09735, partial [Verrucomicrobiota bacterium]
MKRQAETMATQQNTSKPDTLAGRSNPARRMQQRVAHSKMPNGKSPVEATTIPNATARAIPTNGRRNMMDNSRLGLRDSG